MMKIVHWTATDAEVRKLGEQTGLDTLVVLAVNDDYWGPMRTGCAFGNVETGGAWLSTARVVRCWVKSRNERNPYC